MNSAIVQFRTLVLDQIQEKVTDLREIDWYDGMFDEEDIKDWSLSTPCAFVAATRSPTMPHSTGELNAAVDMLVVVICQDDRAARDSDAECWSIMEQIAILAQNNRFGSAAAGEPTALKFDRLRDPAMRREGVAVGVVAWTTCLTIGENFAAEDAFLAGLAPTPASTSAVIQSTVSGVPDGVVLIDGQTPP